MFHACGRPPHTELHARCVTGMLGLRTTSRPRMTLRGRRWNFLR
jgi:hypothetical protein